MATSVPPIMLKRSASSDHESAASVEASDHIKKIREETDKAAQHTPQSDPNRTNQHKKPRMSNPQVFGLSGYVFSIDWTKNISEFNKDSSQAKLFKLHDSASFSFTSLKAKYTPINTTVPAVPLRLTAVQKPTEKGSPQRSIQFGTGKATSLIFSKFDGNHLWIANIPSQDISIIYVVLRSRRSRKRIAFRHFKEDFLSRATWANTQEQLGLHIREESVDGFNLLNETIQIHSHEKLYCQSLKERFGAELRELCRLLHIEKKLAENTESTPDKSPKGKNSSQSTEKRVTEVADRSKQR